jgi:hypothetical protein
MDKKKSIINVQDLGLSIASWHSIGGQPILQVIYREPSIFRKFFHFLKESYLLKSIFRKFSGYQRADDTLNESPESFKKSRNKHFVHN